MPVPTWRSWLCLGSRRKKHFIRPAAARRPIGPFLRLEELEGRLTPSITFLATPAAGTAGQSLGPAVKVQVLNGGESQVDDPVTLTVNSGPADFIPTSTTTVTTDQFGIATFSNLVLDASGDYTFVAKDVFSEGASSPPSPVVAVNPAPASQVAIVTDSSDVSQGDSLGFTVTAVDAFGNPATGSTIHFNSSAAQSSLPADYTFQAGDNGEQSFAASFTDAGSQTLTVAVLNTTVTATADVEVQPDPQSNVQPDPQSNVQPDPQSNVQAVPLSNLQLNVSCCRRVD